VKKKTGPKPTPAGGSLANRSVADRSVAGPTGQTTRNPRSSNAQLLRDHIVDRTCRLADAMIRMSSRHIQDRWKVRHTDLRLLNVLDGEEPLSVNEISRRALVDQAWVSRSLRLATGHSFGASESSSLAAVS